jgi:hypothetical protein
LAEVSAGASAEASSRGVSSGQEEEVEVGAVSSEEEEAGEAEVLVLGVSLGEEGEVEAEEVHNMDHRIHLLYLLLEMLSLCVFVCVVPQEADYVFQLSY